MTISIGSYEDLEPEPDRPIDRNPSMPCDICGESFNWQDYWKHRIVSTDVPETAPFWCDDCEEEIEAIRERLSKNKKLTEWTGRSVEPATDHGGGE